MKKAILLCGSPNTSGSTARLLAEAARGMAAAGLQTQSFFLADMDIRPCVGCGACRESRRCARRDGMDMLTEALLGADVVCLGSPSYWGDVTAQTKAFIDRCLPLCDTLAGGTTVPPGKLGMAVAVRAGRSAAESLRLIGTMEHWFGHLGIRPAARLHAERINCPGDLLARQDALREAYEQGLGILNATENVDGSFSLRQAAPEDAPELAEMNRGLISDEGSDNPMTPPELERRMAGFLAGEYRGVLVKMGEETAGYCLYQPEEVHNGGGPGVYIRQYYIKPGFRRRGIGKAALKSIIDTYFAGAAFVSLDVLECNETGKAFWAGAGFRPVYRRMAMDLPGKPG